MSLDHRMIPFAITVTLMAVIFVFWMIVFLITFQKKQNRKSRQYLQLVIQEKDRTMSRISLEVHDNVNQVLNAARMNVHMLSNSAQQSQMEIIDRIGGLLDKLIIDTNNISHTLNTEYLMRKGLVQSLKEEATWVSNSKRCNCVLKTSGITERFDGQLELMLFRIAQEAVNNAIKHAVAANIFIAVNYDFAGFTMTISDDGKGFDANTTSITKGVGLLSMQSRAKIVQGKLNIRSSVGAGTTIEIFIPRTALKVANPMQSGLQRMQADEFAAESSKSS